MTQLLSRTGSRNQEFNQYDDTYEYQQFSMVSKDGNVYRSNDVIAAGTTFAVGTTGATWELVIQGTGASGGTSIVNGTSNVDIATADGNITMAVNGSATQLEVGETDLSITDPLIQVGSGTNVAFTRGHYFPTPVIDLVATANTGETTGSQSIAVIQTLTSAVTGDLVTGAGIDANTFVTGISANSQVINLNKPIIGAIDPGNSITLTATKNRFIGYDTTNSQFAVATNIGVSNNKITGTTTYGNLKASYFIGIGANLGAVGNLTITGGTSGQVLSTDGSGVLSWADGGSGTGTAITNGDSSVDIPDTDGDIIVTANGILSMTIDDTTSNIHSSVVSFADPVLEMGALSNNQSARGLALSAPSTVVSPVLTSILGVGGTSIFVDDITGIVVGQYISSSTPGIFKYGTHVTAINSGTSEITFTPNVDGALSIGDTVIFSQIVSKFMGYDTANSQFAMMSSVSNTTGTINELTGGAVVYGNLKVGNFIGNLANGNSSVKITANANIAISSNGVANIMVFSANAIDGLTPANSQITLGGVLTADDTTLLAIGGGSNGQFLQTDGASNLIWASASYGQLYNDTFTATNNQTVFTLTNTPRGAVALSINGATVKAAAVSVTSATLTYVPADNLGYALRAGDVITAIYQYGATTTTTLSQLSGVNIVSPVDGEVLTYDAATDKWINAAGGGGSGAAASIANGTSNVTMTSGGNVRTSVGGVANVFVVTNAGANVDGNFGVNGNVVFTGNLTVQGTTTTANATSLDVTNPIISEGGATGGGPLTTNDGKDRGLLQYYYTTAPVSAFMGWKNANGEFIFGSNVSNASDVITVNTYGNIRAGSLNVANIASVGNVTVTGNLSAAKITGTLATGSQPNITAVGTLTGFTSNGAVNFTNASNVTLGAVANVHISGGNNGEVLSTDGSGALSWVAVSSSSISNGNSNVSIDTSNGNVTINAVGNTVMTVTGTGANVTGTANISGNVATANMKVTGQANITANLLVGTFANIAGNLTTSANLKVTDDANIGGELLVTGNANVATDMNLSGELILTGNSNISGTIYGLGNVDFTGANVSLGDVANLHITGGDDGQFLQTDSTGVLTWATVGMSATGVDSFTATANQASFTVAHAPLGDVLMTINGATVPNNAVTVSNVTVSYANANNSSYALEANDVVTLNYVYSATGTTSTTLANVGDVTFGTLVNGQLLSYDSGTSKWVNDAAKVSTNAVRGTPVTLGSIKARISDTGSINVQIATTSGTMNIVGTGTSVVGATATSAAASASLTTSFASLASTWDMTTQGSTETWTIADTTSGSSWRITAIYTTGDGTASLTIERLN